MQTAVQDLVINHPLNTTKLKDKSHSHHFLNVTIVQMLSDGIFTL
jgi:hypothetical protein